jgi:ketosteroid isomerase-like protein
VSDENTDAVRRFWSSPQDEIWTVVAEDIDYRAIEGAPDDVGVMHGREALGRYLADWAETFEGFRADLEEAEPLGDDRVLAVGRISGRARSSGIETQLRLAILYTVRDGMIVSGREYATEDEARAAAARPD